MDLADLLIAAVPPQMSAPVTTWGVVSVASPCQVRFAGATAGTRIKASLGSYTPVLNDVVALLAVGAEWWILGKRTAV